MTNVRPLSRSQGLYDEVSRHSFGLSTSARFSRLAVTEGKGVYLRDLDGNWYLDLHAGPAVMSTGHGHPVILESIKRQLGSLVHCHDLPAPSRLELQESLLRMMPGPPRRVGLLSGGSEAIELALRLARGYTGRDRVVVFTGAFHGKTLGALAATDPMFRENWWCDQSSVFRLPYADCTRCHLGLTYPCCDTACAEFVTDHIDEGCSELPAALLVEPAQGSAGNIIPPVPFLDHIFSHCRDRGIVVIADEILTGCGRTGSFLATEAVSTDPEIIVLGKGLGSGYPISAVLPVERIGSSSIANSVGSSSTSYGGNPLAAMAGAATLRVFEEEELIDNAAQTGKLFLQVLSGLAERSERIQNVRGRGLMLGFDLDPALGPDAGKRLFEACLENGLMIMGLRNRVRLNPPLTFEPRHVYEAVAKLEAALTTTEESLS